jgi:metal-responsive CopG/Arc/MetJ family transcriptional regulator
MSLKSRGRPRERTQGQRTGPMVDAELLREFDATAAKEGLSRNKALEEAMRSFVSARRHRNPTQVSDQS